MKRGTLDTTMIRRPGISAAIILFLLLILPCLIGFLGGFPRRCGAPQ